MSLHVKKGDTVLIIAGKDKGKTGKVTSADPDSSRVVVDGYNIITKHVKPKSATQAGGINKSAGPIDASNVQIVCPACSKAVRIANKEINGKKVRVCPKCGANLDEKKADKKAAKKSAKADKADKAEAIVDAPVDAVVETKAKKVAAKKTKKVAEEATVVENTEKSDV